MPTGPNTNVRLRKILRIAAHSMDDHHHHKAMHIRAIDNFESEVLGTLVEKKHYKNQNRYLIHM